MTKHKPTFSQRVIPSESAALIDFVQAHGFILATKRTRSMLLALVADGVLKVKDNRFTMKGKRK